jgi:hypothetical protein
MTVPAELRTGPIRGPGCRLVRLAGSSSADLPLALLCAVVFAAWEWVGAGGVSVRYLVMAAAVSLVAVAAGGLAERALRFRYPWDFPLRFLAGYFLVNAVLYVLVWAVPFGIVADFWIVAGLTAAVAAAVWLRARRGPAAAVPVQPSPAGSWVPPALCVVLSLVAVSLWAQDSVVPVARHGQTVIVKPWHDTPIHMAQISIFAASHGASTIHESRMAGAPEHFAYHYASYILPALMTAAGKAPAYLAFGCYWVPVGLFLIALAAYALVRAWWGPWPAVAAVALLVLAPDAAYQGFDNYFLSYHWLIQVTAASGYGMAVAAVAWVLMFEACRARRFGLMFVSFFTLGAGLIFKAHMVVPNTLPLYAFPALAMAGIRPRWRVAWLAGAVLSFVLVVYVSQRSPEVPVLRPNFSSTKEYLVSIVRQFEHDGPVKQAFFSRFTPNSTLSHDLMWGAAMLIVCTFGVAGLAYPFLAVGQARSMRLSVLLFPLMVVGVYLFMSLALAYDDRQIGRPEELQHRPFPWAYFVLYAWVGGAAYRAVWGDAAPPRVPARVALGLLLVAGLAVPAYCGHNVALGPAGTWGLAQPNTYKPFDAGLIDAATYIRRQSRGRRPVMQDSSADPLLIVSAFAEAQPYAANCRVTIRSPKGLVGRLEEVKRLPEFRDARDVRKFAVDRGIAWYLLRPGDKVNWPSRFLSHPAYESHGYRVYHFDVSPPPPSKSK